VNAHRRVEDEKEEEAAAAEEEEEEIQRRSIAEHDYLEGDCPHGRASSVRRFDGGPVVVLNDPPASDCSA